MSLYSFHGRGTLNGTIPHPALVALFAEARRARGIDAAAERPDRRPHRLLLCAARRRGRRRDRSRLSLPLHAFLARGLRPRRSRRADAAPRRGHRAHRAGLQPRSRRLRNDSAYLGIDIGTFESKGVLVDRDGDVARQRREAAQMHRAARRAGPSTAPNEDWWGDFASLTAKAARRERRSRRRTIKAVGASAIGPCMLPVDADGEPLMNAVLYGVDTRAAARDRGSDRRDRRGCDPRPLRQCADLAVGRPEDPLAEAQPAGDLRAGAHKILNSTSFLVHRLTGRFVDRPLHAPPMSSPLYDGRRAALERRADAATSSTSNDCRSSPGRRTSPAA